MNSSSSNKDGEKEEEEEEDEVEDEDGEEEDGNSSDALTGELVSDVVQRFRQFGYACLNFSKGAGWSLFLVPQAQVAQASKLVHILDPNEEYYEWMLE